MCQVTASPGWQQGDKGPACSAFTTHWCIEARLAAAAGPRGPAAAPARAWACDRAPHPPAGVQGSREPAPPSSTHEHLPVPPVRDPPGAAPPPHGTWLQTGNHSEPRPRACPGGRAHGHSPAQPRPQPSGAPRSLQAPAAPPEPHRGRSALAVPSSQSCSQSLGGPRRGEPDPHLCSLEEQQLARQAKRRRSHLLCP